MSTILTTQRLRLRSFQASDWERVHIYSSNADFSKFEVWGPNTVEETQAFVNLMVAQVNTNPRYEFDFAICLKENGLLIGSCGIRMESNTSLAAKLGWSVNPEFQNQGFATEAAKAVIDFGFKSLKLKNIYASCDTRNKASFRVMEKLGMSRIQTIRADKIIKGHLRESYLYDLTTKVRF